MTEEKLAILERFGSLDEAELVAEIRRLRVALTRIFNESRNGLAMSALLGIDFTPCEVDPVSASGGR